MCRADGRKTLAGGNLGEPALDLLELPEPALHELDVGARVGVAPVEAQALDEVLAGQEVELDLPPLSPRAER